MVDNITRANIADELNQKLGLTWRQCSELVDGLVEEVTLSMVKGEEVKITNFGTFELRQKKQRIGRNPRTGAPAVISARKVLVFHPSHNLKNRISNHG